MDVKIDCSPRYMAEVWNLVEGTVAWVQSSEELERVVAGAPPQLSLLEPAPSPGGKSCSSSGP